MNKKLKEFFELEQQLKQLSKRVLRAKTFESAGQSLPLYLTEIYFRSREITKIIDDIRRKADMDINKNNVDELLTQLVNLRIEIYDEVIDWMKALRGPLKVIINETDDMLSHIKQKSGRKVTRSTRKK